MLLPSESLRILRLLIFLSLEVGDAEPLRDLDLDVDAERERDLLTDLLRERDLVSLEPLRDLE